MDPPPPPRPPFFNPYLTQPPSQSDSQSPPPPRPSFFNHYLTQPPSQSDPPRSPFFNSYLTQLYNSPPPSQSDSQFSQPSHYELSSIPPQISHNPQHPPPILNYQNLYTQAQFPYHPPFQTTNLQPTTSQNNSDQTEQLERNPNFTTLEDEALCKAWLRVSENPITGTDQSKKSLWENVLAEFKKVLGTETFRVSTSLSNRWSIIQREINKYSAAVTKVDNSPRSGFGTANIIDEYHKQYSRSNRGAQFKLDGCWLILKDTPKWFHYRKEQSEKQQKVRQRKRANVDANGNGDSSNPTTPAATPGSATESVNLDDDDSPFTQGPQELQRPPGRKQAKAKRYNKNFDGMNLFAKQFDNMRKEQKEIAENELIMAREREEQRIQERREQERLRREAKFERERMKIIMKNEQERIKMEKEIMMTDPTSLPTKEGRDWLSAQQKSIWARMQGGVGDGSSGSGDGSSGSGV